MWAGFYYLVAWVDRSEASKRDRHGCRLKSQSCVVSSRAHHHRLLTAVAHLSSKYSILYPFTSKAITKKSNASTAIDSIVSDACRPKLCHRFLRDNRDNEAECCHTTKDGGGGISIGSSFRRQNCRGGLERRRLGVDATHYHGRGVAIRCGNDDDTECTYLIDLFSRPSSQERFDDSRRVWRTNASHTRLVVSTSRTALARISTVQEGKGQELFGTTRRSRIRRRMHHATRATVRSRRGHSV
jgi:hypothetical protein